MFTFSVNIMQFRAEMKILMSQKEFEGRGQMHQSEITESVFTDSSPALHIPVESYPGPY